jgi:hypothetical protein
VWCGGWDFRCARDPQVSEVSQAKRRGIEGGKEEGKAR